MLAKVQNAPHNATTLDQVVAANFLPRNTAGFYRYEGSLTTPNCNEVVIWTLFTNTIPISKKQVSAIRLISLKKTIRHIVLGTAI